MHQYDSAMVILIDYMELIEEIYSIDLSTEQKK